MLGFLSAFLETQMFTSFIDSKILLAQQKGAENVKMFDRKIAELERTKVEEYQNQKKSREAEKQQIVNGKNNIVQNINKFMGTK